MNQQEKYTAACRDNVYRHNTREFLLSKISGSEQENDLTLPPNCNGFGRVRHFRRKLDDDWYDPLPMDPMSKSLKIPFQDMVQAQVFQIASCNLRCWYCFVPDSLKKADKLSNSWFTADQMVGLFAEAKEKAKLIDLSGGNPELAPEWVLDTMKAIEKHNLMDEIYLWSDDTLTTDYFFKYLDSNEINHIKNYPHYGKVGCFKGYDNESFSFNTNLSPKQFDLQFELFNRYLDIGIDIYGYVTFTTNNIEKIEDKINGFISRLRKIHPLLPLRIVPLKIVKFGSVAQRINTTYDNAICNQYIVHQEWRKQLRSLYSDEQLTDRICDISLF